MQSLAAGLGDLTATLQTYAASPGNDALGLAALGKAKQLVGRLHDASASVQTVRDQADADIAASVERVNGLLADFDAVETTILKDIKSGADVTESLDRRDAILSSLSEEIGIRALARADGSTLLTTESGAVLFDREPRPVAFKSAGTLAAGAPGASVFVDGIDVTSSASPMRITSGKIAGAVEVRDGTAVAYQAQIDEIARGLIVVFRESDMRSPASLPDAPGLFTYPGAPAMPGVAVQPGLAGLVAVSATVDPEQGGDTALLRDGGIADPSEPAYRSNPSAAAGFSDRIRDLIAKVSDAQAFAPEAELGTPASLSGYAEASVAWISAGRQSASEAAEQQGVVRDRTSAALSNATGVNLDDEMSRLLDLEHAYQASAKLIATIDNLYQMLFQAVSA